ncbi:M23 family metallopeptidase [Tellurirhabdus rosea]|uniref:M23 family metallopeptidase n=1 Tax=Tellurirhabdus rosea TaxID=2674997 RepID=UPI00225622C2|nr:M23 family metallopeptidase [Tellurirhabdus rosea]
MRLLSFLFAFLLSGWLPAFAQGDRVQISYTRDASTNDHTSSFVNSNYCDYTVVVNFSSLQGLTCSCSLPYTGAVRPGQGRLFTLKASANGQPSFQYSYTSYKGRLMSKAPADFVYLLPVATGKKVLASETKPIGEAMGKERAEGFYSLAFKLQPGDTIFAARRGTVSDLRDAVEPAGQELWFSRETNFVEIFQADGTFARYDKLKKGQIWVKPGDVVESGQPIGLIGGENFTGGPSLFFSVYFLARKTVGTQETSYKFQHVKPVFAVQGQDQGTALTNQQTYEAVRPETVLFQELSKREAARRRQKGK